jgi:hypothetical protein
MGHARWLPTALVLPAGLMLPAAGAQALSSGPVLPATPPSDVSVTVYRAPYHESNTLDLDQLEGFALITEKRTVSLPAGLSQVRFEGVADGVEPASAILSGLPGTLLEKNRDARVLSPSALVSATVGHRVELVRTDRRSGRQTRVAGTLRANNEGVVFESPLGIEALRCLGVPETFEFSSISDLTPTPTLSVAVRTEQAVTAQVTLSYLAHGFDWTASYTAKLSPDAHQMDLGAWVTLANSNGVVFPSARAQLVAGRLNRESGQVEPVEEGGEILAQCWPQGSTGSPPPDQEKVLFEIEESGERDAPTSAANIRYKKEDVYVEPEQLGDLKLYRVPERTTVGSRQMKQVRLLDRQAVPVNLIYSATLLANQATSESIPVLRVLRTRNDAAHHLGLPLPSGVVQTFTTQGQTLVFLAEDPLRDTAVNEEVEITIGLAPDVQVRAVHERTTVGPSQVKEVPLLPGVVRLRSAVVDELNRIEISNARRAALTFEASVTQLDEGLQLIRAQPAPIWHRGVPVFRVKVPVGGRATIRYQTEHVSHQVVR